MANQDQTSESESQENLRKIRYNLTRSKTILDELENYYKQFDEIRSRLDDTDNGLETNLRWSNEKKAELDKISEEALAKLTELQQLKESTESSVASIKEAWDEFEPLSAKIKDPSSGLDAIHANATDHFNKMQSLLANFKSDYATTQTTIADILAKHAEIETAYDSFIGLKEKVEDPEEGIEAQFDAIKKFAKDAAQAKNNAESELASVISLKQTATDDLSDIQTSKEQIETLRQEGATLVEDIKNNLDISTRDSLSAAITTQRKRFDTSVKVWGFATGLTTLLLAFMLGFIYYTLFVAEGEANVLSNTTSPGAMLVTVVSKAIFSAPFIFALYFTTLNFSRVKDLRDNYIGKEIAAKNLQAYVKLLRSQFKDFTEQRLEFTLKNMQAIYDDPTLIKKKRRYNIGINKIFQFDIQEEDAQDLKDTWIEGAESLVERKKKNSK